jgi:hypothetical protein
MNKAIIYALGMLLIAGSATEIAPAFARQVRRAPTTSNETFRNAYASTEGTARWCSEDPGNPYNPQTDYMAWSAWRAHGAWDSRNDC